MNRRSLRRVGGVWIVLILIGSPVLLAQESKPAPPLKRQRDAVHLVDPLRPHDPKLLDTLEGAVASLQAGHEVVILFDGQSVTALRMHMRKGKKTLLEEAEIAGTERQTLAERLGMSPSEAPRNYLEYVQHLVKAGAKVYANRNTIRLYGLTEGEIHPIAKPISMRQMAELLDESDLCYTYGGR